LENERRRGVTKAIDGNRSDGERRIPIDVAIPAVVGRKGRWIPSSLPSIGHPPAAKAHRPHRHAGAGSRRVGNNLPKKPPQKGGGELLLQMKPCRCQVLGLLRRVQSLATVPRAKIVRAISRMVFPATSALRALGFGQPRGADAIGALFVGS
jgi:hypothetical protein